MNDFFENADRINDPKDFVNKYIDSVLKPMVLAARDLVSENKIPTSEMQGAADVQKMMVTSTNLGYSRNYGLLAQELDKKCQEWQVQIDEAPNPRLESAMKHAQLIKEGIEARIGHK